MDYYLVRKNTLILVKRKIANPKKLTFVVNTEIMDFMGVSVMEGLYREGELSYASCYAVEYFCVIDVS